MASSCVPKVDIGTRLATDIAFSRKAPRRQLHVDAPRTVSSLAQMGDGRMVRELYGDPMSPTTREAGGGSAHGHDR